MTVDPRDFDSLHPLQPQEAPSNDPRAPAPDPVSRRPIPAGGDDPSSDATRLFRSADLFAGSREVWIQHEEQIYRLRLTRNGKLILVK